MECESDHTVYLRTLAPLNQLYHMLCASPQPWPWFHRQLAFVKRDQRSDKLIWSTRAEYLVADAQAFRRELLAYGAEQLHLGTLVYDSEDTRGRLQRQWHEVVLDIDLTDFTRYCDCGEKKQACGQCWLHIEGTQLLLRYLLCHVLLVEERHLLWVFSGKKGIHCVCNDPRLCVTDANARKRLIALLRRDTTDTLWQLAQELPSDVALQVEQLFERRAITHARALLAVPAFRKHCLTLVRQYCPALYNTLVQSWAGAPDSVRDWAALKGVAGQPGPDRCDAADCAHSVLSAHRQWPAGDEPQVQGAVLCARRYTARGATNGARGSDQRHTARTGAHTGRSGAALQAHRSAVRALRCQCVRV